MSASDKALWAFLGRELTLLGASLPGVPRLPVFVRETARPSKLNPPKVKP